MAGVGGKRPGAGRKPGVPNKASGEIRAMAQQHGPQALVELARLASEAESEQARLGAIREILDRAYGKPVQMVSGDPDGVPVSFLITNGPDPKA